MTALFHRVLCAAFSKVTVVALREWFVIILVIFAYTSLQQLQCRLVWFLFAADWITHSFQYVPLLETITHRFHYTPFPVLLVLPTVSFTRAFNPVQFGLSLHADSITRAFRYSRFQRSLRPVKYYNSSYGTSSVEFLHCESQWSAYRLSLQSGQ